MTLTIDLTPAEGARLAAAARRAGAEPADVMRKLVTEHLPLLPDGEEDPTLALFGQWSAEDARMTPEEAAEEQRLWERFEGGVNETRDALGMRRL